MRRDLVPTLLAAWLAMGVGVGDTTLLDLVKARGSYNKAIIEAESRLLDEFGKRIEASRIAGDAEMADELWSQRKDFQARKELPFAAPMKPARMRYQKSAIEAKQSHLQALGKALEGFTAAEKPAEVRKVQDEAKRIEGEISAIDPKKVREKADARLVTRTRWKGKLRRDVPGGASGVASKFFDVECLVQLREGDKLSLQFTTFDDGGRDGVAAVEATLGKLDASGMARGRRFTWGRGPGTREGWIRGKKLSWTSRPDRGNLRESGEALLVDEG